ncbi:MAG: hypothetical protein BEN19_04215 [Epulopiscium sp. Nuni2H_MBin003]|nr:MAG: hypothetical protein BEN19_04215 [Epulopiscium sp. Nuni2H_MBin003]
MDTAILKNLFMDLSLISILLILGTFIRNKFVKHLLIPVSVIGGIIGLILGEFLIDDQTMITLAALPNILIIPIFAALPFCTNFNKKLSAKTSVAKLLLNCGTFGIIREVQLVVGFSFTILCSYIIKDIDLYRTFGFELSQGFSGGHGTAIGVGAVLYEFGIDYWEVSSNVANTFATIGLIGGMTSGIIFINIYEKKANKHFNYKNLNNDITLADNKENLGLESISLHIAVILIVCAIAYYIVDIAKAYNIWGLSSLPVWFIALIVMHIVNIIIIKLNLYNFFDVNIKNRVVGTLSDFAITSAITSIKIATILQYIIPIIILSIIGFIITYFMCFNVFKKIYKEEDFYFERAILTYGVNTGVTINGMALLKVCDAEYKTPALSEFSSAFSLVSLISLFTYPIMYYYIDKGTTMQNLLCAIFTTLIYLSLIVIGKAMIKVDR